MSYRVTNNMMRSLLLNDMHNNLNKLLTVQQQMATQRKYNSATENPNAVTKGMGLETMMTEGDQYRQNLLDAVAWLKFTDDALGDMNDIFQRIRELALYAGDGGLENVDLGAIATELAQLKEEMRSYANASMAGEYLFAGLKASDIPFNLGANGEVVYDGNLYDIFWEFARSMTGKVSVNGREVFPLDETDYTLKGIEVPIDFNWEGRNEILEFNVGWQTVKVRIPERWEDEIRNGLTDAEDYNRFRDPGEMLDGYSLQEIADLINNSTEMGDVSKLLKATVIQDLDRGVQYLQIKALTGEAVRLTSWQEEDAQAVSQGIMGAGYGPAGRTAGSSGKIEIRFDDNNTYSVDVAAGDDLQTIAGKLNQLQDGRVWAAYKTDGVNEWLDIVSRKPGETMYLTATGGGAQLFAQGTERGTFDGTNYVLTSNASDPSATFEGTLTFTMDDGTIVPPLTISPAMPLDGPSPSVVDEINTLASPPLTASVVDGKLVVTSASGFTVEATDGLT
ncbi:MAG: flagellar hook-associated protein FlgL, partial [Synergistaceae bacterium]|nr:flagellar hook-associated protein FlgL [Synergistaceae bacterium]